MSVHEEEPVENCLPHFPQVDDDNEEDASVIAQGVYGNVLSTEDEDADVVITRVSALPIIKLEEAEDSSWSCTNTYNEAILLSDCEDEVTVAPRPRTVASPATCPQERDGYSKEPDVVKSKAPITPDDSGSPRHFTRSEQIDLTEPDTIMEEATTNDLPLLGPTGTEEIPRRPLQLGQSVLHSPNKRPDLSPTRVKQIKKIQQIMAAKIKDKYLAGGGSKIFGSHQGKGNEALNPINNNGVHSEASPLNAIGDTPRSPNHGFDWENNSSDSDGDAAAAFAELRTQYMNKNRAKTATVRDEILFNRAATAEKLRLRRLELDHLPETGSTGARDTPPPPDDNEDCLFLKEIRGQKQPRSEDKSSDVNMDGAESSDGPPFSKRRKPMVRKKKPHNSISKHGFETSMLAGMEEDVANQEKAAKRLQREAKKQEREARKKTLKPTEKPAGRTIKPRTKSKADKTRAKSSKAGKETKKKATGKKASAGKGKSNLLDLGSLVTSNVYRDANENLNRTALAAPTERRKDDALKQLLASVPEQDRRGAQTDKRHVHEATKMLGKYKVNYDGNGGWVLKGMSSSLRNYQVMGAAFMREREIGTEEPLGGLCADEMGFGKTVMMIAAMIANPPLPGDTRKTTLIVATRSLVTQWADEIDKHTKDDALGIVVRHHSGSKTIGPGAVQFLQMADVVLTTYTEVLKSYPKYDPPKELVSSEEVRFEMNGSELSHNADESAESTVVEKRYFKFLRVKFTGSYEVFRLNFCHKGSDAANGRLHSFLRKFMIRRTHKDSLFGAPLIKLPKNTQQTIVVHFNEVERAIYETVRSRYIQRINTYSAEGTAERKYHNILTMLLRLRQMTAHIFLLQTTIEDIFELEDIERLWEVTANEHRPDTLSKNLLAQMKKMIVAKNASPSEDRKGIDQEAAPMPEPDVVDEIGENGQTPGLAFKFRKYIKQLSENSKWEEMKTRSLCHRCREPPEEPHVTSCMHVYCAECLYDLGYEAASNDLDGASCLECGTQFAESKPCEGLTELGWNNDQGSSSSQGDTAVGRRRRPRKNPEDDLKWIDSDGAILPSAKILALIAQIELWTEKAPNAKIIVFTQFHMMIKIIERVCNQRDWGSVTYHGKMSHSGRDKAIQEFKNNADKMIMIASLKCGGVGLNLTMASRVICIDLWWNSSVEQQAFCRIFRIGQEEETHISRFVVANTVDEKLQNMQDGKQIAIGAAMGDNGNRPGKLSLTQLMKLFGPVEEDAEHRAFIIADDDDEYERTVPTIIIDDDDNISVGLPPHEDD
ncbi:MAG: hypothetical protein M1827_002210 [Pycnora praestabilis]|nr:MAG: hypothetical protein M1827_002210 [Pycnora praestabilis]